MEKSHRNPTSPWNPREPLEISPTEFEDQVGDWLAEAADQENLVYTTTRLGVVKGTGGQYKIDVLVRVAILGGTKITILVKCKHQKRPVERAEVLELKAKLDDVHAHKGMMFSTSGFQSGAIKYAAAHGIATVTVVAGEWLFETRAIGSAPKPPPWAHLDRFVGIRLIRTAKGIGSHTIEKGRPDAILEWLKQ